MVEDIFKFATLGVLVAFGFTVLTHSSETATILSSGFTGYNSTLSTLEGR